MKLILLYKKNQVFDKKNQKQTISDITISNFWYQNIIFWLKKELRNLLYKKIDCLIWKIQILDINK